MPSGRPWALILLAASMQRCSPADAPIGGPHVRRPSEPDAESADTGLLDSGREVHSAGDAGDDVVKDTGAIERPCEDPGICLAAITARAPIACADRTDGGPGCVPVCREGFRMVGSHCLACTGTAACGLDCGACPEVQHGRVACAGNTTPASASCAITCDPGYTQAQRVCAPCNTTAACGADCTACPVAPADGAYSCAGNGAPSAQSCRLSCAANHRPWNGQCSACAAISACVSGSGTCPSVPVTGLDCENETDPPTNLGCTYLYSDWNEKTISSDVRLYDPGLHLWSDGADKTRYIYLPPDAQIDTGDMDEWNFPVGTRIWKEFRVGTSTNWNGIAPGTRIETRYLEKVRPPSPGDPGWNFTTYVWSNDGSTATRSASGQTNWRGTSYEIPSADLAMCQRCHKGRLDFVLGFEAVALSTPMSAIDGRSPAIRVLVDNNLLNRPPSRAPSIPGNPQESAALGYLHINCGVCCHNGSQNADARVTGFFMRLDIASLASAASTETYRTGVRVVSVAQPSPVPSPPWYRIDPEHPETSMLYWRDSSRDQTQPTGGGGGPRPMPPLCTHVVDAAGLGTVRAWINGLP